MKENMNINPISNLIIHSVGRICLFSSLNMAFDLLFLLVDTLYKKNYKKEGNLTYHPLLILIAVTIFLRFVLWLPCGSWVPPYHVWLQSSNIYFWDPGSFRLSTKSEPNLQRDLLVTMLNDMPPLFDLHTYTVISVYNSQNFVGCAGYPALICILCATTWSSSSLVLISTLVRSSTFEASTQI